MYYGFENHQNHRRILWKSRRNDLLPIGCLLRLTCAVFELLHEKKIMIILFFREIEKKSSLILSGKDVKIS